MSDHRLEYRSSTSFRRRTNNRHGSGYYRSRQTNTIRENNRNYGSRSDYDRSSNRINRHGGIGSGRERYSSHREYSIQVDNNYVTRINFPVHVNASIITDILQDLESDHIQSLHPGVAIALLHKIGKCRCDKKTKSFDIRNRVISKIIDSLPEKFSNVHIGNSCYGLKNISKATIKETA